MDIALLDSLEADLAAVDAALATIDRLVAEAEGEGTERSDVAERLLAAVPAERFPSEA